MERRGSIWNAYRNNRLVRSHWSGQKWAIHGGKGGLFSTEMERSLDSIDFAADLDHFSIIQ